MATFPTNVNLNDLIPVAKPDAFNVEFQAGTPYPDPNSPGFVVRDTSACYRVPNVGGVLLLAGDYSLNGSDSGFTLIANSATPITFTLPASIPVLAPGEGIWTVKIINIGLGEVTLDVNGATLDGLTPASPYTGYVLEQ